MYIQRIVEKTLRQLLEDGKSILLLGPRQTGKTTLLNQIHADKRFTLANLRERLRYEKDPSVLAFEIEQLAADKEKIPLVIVDEIQKIPILIDAVQDLIDRKVAQFILTGSSARKLRKGRSDMNLLPGRVIPLRLDPFMYSELLRDKTYDLMPILLDGTLPEVVLEKQVAKREMLLDAYVSIYLEEEIRAEAMVREIGHFARFLELAAANSGKIINFTKLSQAIGVTHSTIVGYYDILEDCLIVERVESLSESKVRKKLSKSPKYLFYDLGVRRVAAHEGRRLSREQMGHLFEQYVGLEIIRNIRSIKKRYLLKYWRDPGGVEVDWVLETEAHYFPIEVKWTDSPTGGDAKHLQTFLDEYPKAKKGFIVCRTPHAMKLSEDITAIPWEAIHTIVSHAENYAE